MTWRLVYARHHHRGSLSAANADGGASEAGAALLHGGQEGDQDTRAGAADRVSQSHGAAADVDPLGSEPEVAHEGESHDGEGLVDLPEVDVGGLEAGALQHGL